jgi:hypothetical protein
MEILDHSESSIMLDRLCNGGPLFKRHSGQCPAIVENGRRRMVVRLKGGMAMTLKHCFTVIGGVKTNEGIHFKYPMTIRLI